VGLARVEADGFLLPGLASLIASGNAAR
jgi:hypothetical protein